MPRGKREEGTLKDGRKPPIFIHSDIDDMTDLSPNAMRVYMHLARRADKTGTAWPSYQSMGDHCFGSVYKHRDTRRKVAIESIAELIEAHLIRKEMRQDESGQQSNCYVLLDPPVTVQSPPPVIVESQGSDPVITAPCDPTVTAPCDRGVTPPVIYRSPKDHPCEGTPIEGTPLEDHPSSSSAREVEQKLSEKPDDDDDDDLSGVYKAWTDAMDKKPTNRQKEQLAGLAAEHSAAEVIRAIFDSADAGGHSYRYVETTLLNRAADIQPPGRESYTELPPDNGRKTGYGAYMTSLEVSRP